MDDARFDAATRALGSSIDRRTTARTLAAGALASLGLGAGHDAGAKKKKKKKCKKPKVKCGKTCCAAGQKCIAGKCAVPCTFVTAGSVMTLQANCTTTSTIEIPNGVTLDGNGKTISLAGSPSGSGITNASGAVNCTIRNLTVDGAKLPDGCANAVSGIRLLGTAAGIENVSVANIPCGAALDLVGSDAGPRFAVDVVDLSVSNVSLSGGGAVSVTGAIDATITDSRVSDLESATFAIHLVGGGATAEISDSTFENVVAALFTDGSLGPSLATADNNAVTNAAAGFVVGGTGVSLVATDNTIVGPGAGAPGFAGIAYSANASGAVSGNTISNYFDADPGTVACGIRVEADAGAVTIGTNTFPDPPGNEQNVCDNRP